MKKPQTPKGPPPPAFPKPTTPSGPNSFKLPSSSIQEKKPAAAPRKVVCLSPGSPFVSLVSLEAHPHGASLKRRPLRGSRSLHRQQLMCAGISSHCMIASHTVQGPTATVAQGPTTSAPNSNIAGGVVALAALGLAAAAAANSQQQGQEQEQGSSGGSSPQAGSPTPSPGGAGTSGAPVALVWARPHVHTRLACRCSTPHKHLLSA
jgi:hypothetical protein